MTSTQATARTIPPSEVSAGLPLPALDGRTPLGFLAALGVLRLVNENGHPDAALSWSTRDLCAVLHAGPGTIDDLVTLLEQVVTSIPDDGALPGIPAEFPPRGAAPDKLRLSREGLRDLHGATCAETPDASGAVEAWLAGLVTDLTLDDSGRVDISTFMAPSGKQSTRTMLESPLGFIRRQPQVLREAVEGWRRYSGVTGEYLDNLVLFDGADAPDGKSAERGVPGATWLALMSYPLFLTTGIRGEPLTTGWRLKRGGRTKRFTWPLWSTPLRARSIIALLENPVLDDATPGAPPAPARMLSIFWVGAAERQRLSGRTFAGVLTPVAPNNGGAGKRGRAARRPAPRPGPGARKGGSLTDRIL